MKYFDHPEKGLAVPAVNKAIEQVFLEHGNGRVQMPSKLYVTFPHGDFRTMPAYVPSLGLAGVKVVNVHPSNPARGLPTVMALTLILDIETGVPVSLLNATRLTDLRTGAAGAVAAKYLSPKKTISIGLVGSGRQASAQLDAISAELNVTEVLVWSRKEANASAFCLSRGDIDCRTSSLEEACGCDIVVTTTPSREPIVRDEWIREGTHINAIGADAPGKEELDPAILSRARVIVDDPAQAIHSGEINVPIRKGLFSPEEITGTLGEVVAGRKRRQSPREITVFDSTGLAIQDLAIASIAMKEAGWIDIPFD